MIMETTKNKTQASKPIQNLVSLNFEVLDNRVIKHFIIGKDENRRGNIVNLNGVKFDGFNKTKSVLFNHNPDIIIGKNNNLVVTADGIIAYTKFREDEYSSNIYNLHRDGILNSWSATYIPLAFGNFDEWLEKDVPLEISECDLIEYSSTPIPADPNAIDIIKNNITSNKLMREVEFVELKSNYDTLIKSNAELIALCNELKTNYEKLTPVDLTEIKNEINEIKNNLPKDVGTVARTLSEYEIKDILHNAVSGAVSELTGRKI